MLSVAVEVPMNWKIDLVQALTIEEQLDIAPENSVSNVGNFIIQSDPTSRINLPLGFRCSFMVFWAR
jgi:hypothetical protein